ncbi:MAG: hypothetical protein AVDCRST_MAG89-242, partial [uncultured Gemmatimonadetes bacterium]
EHLLAGPARRAEGAFPSGCDRAGCGADAGLRGQCKRRDLSRGAAVCGAGGERGGARPAPWISCPI